MQPGRIIRKASLSSLMTMIKPNSIRTQRERIWIRVSPIGCAIRNANQKLTHGTVMIRLPIDEKDSLCYIKTVRLKLIVLNDRGDIWQSV